jgi:hypothetical protein
MLITQKFYTTDSCVHRAWIRLQGLDYDGVSLGRMAYSRLQVRPQPRPLRSDYYQKLLHSNANEVTPIAWIAVAFFTELKATSKPFWDTNECIDNHHNLNCKSKWQSTGYTVFPIVKTE